MQNKIIFIALFISCALTGCYPGDCGKGDNNQHHKMTKAELDTFSPYWTGKTISYLFNSTDSMSFNCSVENTEILVYQDECTLIYNEINQVYLTNADTSYYFVCTLHPKKANLGNHNYYTLRHRGSMNFKYEIVAARGFPRDTSKTIIRGILVDKLIKLYIEEDTMWIKPNVGIVKMIISNKLFELL